jgi:hypothetical protein
MKGWTMRRFALVATLGLCTVASGAAQTSVSAFMRGALYPARVSAVNFKVPLNAGTPACVGAWCVGFGPQAPKAEFEDKQSLQFVYIRDLVCKNAGAERPCFLQLSTAQHDDEQMMCTVQIPPVPAGGPNLELDIDCPRSLVLEP